MENASGRSSEGNWHSLFLGMLPRITKIARYAFRKLPPEARDEAVQEAIANALVAYVRLVEQGRSDVARPSSLAKYAVAQGRAGRKVGGRLNVRDILSGYCQRRKGLTVERLDRWDPDEECWSEALVEDRTCTPADLAASRIDFPAWLKTLSVRARRIAQALARGESTGLVARKFGLSAARVSQLRNELREAWRRFHEPHSRYAAAAAAA